MLKLRKNPGKNLNQENWPDRGLNLCPLDNRQRCYISTTAVVLCVWPSPNVAPKPNCLISFKIQYLLCSCKDLKPFFSFSLPLKLRVAHIKKIKNSDFLKNGSYDYDLILLFYSTFETQQYDTIGFSQKIPEARKMYLNQFHSKSISRIFLQISQAAFLFSSYL